MFSRKSLKYYRIEKHVDEDGRIVSTAVYIGGDFALEPPVSLPAKWLIIILCALSWLAFFGAISFVSRITRVSYVMFPFVLSAIPLFLLTTSAVSFLFTGEVVERYKAETIAKRLPQCALVTAVFDAVSFLGLVVFTVLTNDGFPTRDILFGILALVITIDSIVICKKIHKLRAVMINETDQTVKTVEADRTDRVDQTTGADLTDREGRTDQTDETD